MNLNKDLSTLEKTTFGLCILIAVAYILGKMNVYDPLVRDAIISWLALPMLILNAVGYRKKSLFITIACIIGAVIVGIVAVLSLVFFFTK